MKGGEEESASGANRVLFTGESSVRSGRRYEKRREQVERGGREMRLSGGERQ